MTQDAMNCIGSEAKELGLQPLSRNHARFFCQPLGFVEFGVDIDLDEGKGQRYVCKVEPAGESGPFVGTRLVREAELFIVDAEAFTRLKWLLATDAFRDLPEEVQTIGFDGASFLIEADRDGNYCWKCHWCPNETVFLEIVEVLQSLSYEIFPWVKPTSPTALQARKGSNNNFVSFYNAD
jgi:hypothetical protein